VELGKTEGRTRRVVQTPWMANQGRQRLRKLLCDLLPFKSFYGPSY
jgi:hypothetical protein